MRVSEEDAKAKLCPMKVGYSLADRFCEGQGCMAFKKIDEDIRWNDDGTTYSVDIFICGLARVL